MNGKLLDLFQSKFLVKKPSQLSAIKLPAELLCLKKLISNSLASLESTGVGQLIYLNKQTLILISDGFHFWSTLLGNLSQPLPLIFCKHLALYQLSLGIIDWRHIRVFGILILYILYNYLWAEVLLYKLWLVGLSNYHLYW